MDHKPPRPPVEIQGELDDWGSDFSTMRLPSDEEGERIVERLVKRCARRLARLNDPSMLLSGQDSGLKTVWDEICVQCQDMESDDWAAYAATIRAELQGLITDLRPRELLAIWMLTEPGVSYRYDIKHGCPPDPQDARPDEKVIEQLLRRRLFNYAESYTNRKITRFMESRM